MDSNVKRFEYHHEEGGYPYVYDVEDNRMIWDLKCFCELLNHLHEENNQLRFDFKEMKELFLRYENEVMELKSNLANGKCPLCGCVISKCGGLK